LTGVSFVELDRQYGDYILEQAKLVQVMAPEVPPAEEMEDISGADATDEKPSPKAEE